MQQRRVLDQMCVDRLLVDSRPWLSCDDCFEGMDSYVEALHHHPLHQDPAMEAHLRGCGACDDEAQTLIELLQQDGAGGAA